MCVALLLAALARDSDVRSRALSGAHAVSCGEGPCQIGTALETCRQGQPGRLKVATVVAHLFCTAQLGTPALVSGVYGWRCNG